MRIIIVIWICFFTDVVKAQNLTLKVFENNAVLFNEQVTDSLFLAKQIQKISNEFYYKGYIETYVEKTVKTDSVYIIWLNKGKKYQWKEIKIDSSLAYFNPVLATVKKSNASVLETKQALEKAVVFYENNGYPFASVSFVNIKIDSTELSGELTIAKNLFFTIDSIIIKGRTKTNRKVILNALDLSVGEVYNEAKIRGIKDEVNEISFLSLIRSPEIFFSNKGKAMVTLYVEDKNTNQFDGVLGVNTDEGTGDILITGDVSLSLQNVLKRAEGITFEWRKTKTNTQIFLLGTTIPYLFNTKMGIEAGISSFRQDTLFSTIEMKVGLSYLFEFNTRLQVYVSSKNSNNLTKSSQIMSFPAINSSKWLYYGTGFEINKLDYKQNPKKGYNADLFIEVGTKTILKNKAILTQEYTNLPEKSRQYQLRFNLAYFIPIAGKMTIKLGVKGGDLFNKTLFVNELYQIGGLKSIRGFNEQSIFVSNYSIATTEFRFLFDKNSAVFVFSDFAYVENRANQFVTDTPFGFGLGVNLGTKSGVFSLIYALGSQQKNPILIKNGKIHFGYVTVF